MTSHEAENGLSGRPDAILENETDARAVVFIRDRLADAGGLWTSREGCPASHGYKTELDAIRSRIDSRLRGCVGQCRCGGSPEIGFDGRRWEAICRCGRASSCDSLRGLAYSWGDERWRTPKRCP